MSQSGLNIGLNLNIGLIALKAARRVYPLVEKLPKPADWDAGEQVWPPAVAGAAAQIAAAYALTAPYRLPQARSVCRGRAKGELQAVGKAAAHLAAAFGGLSRTALDAVEQGGHDGVQLRLLGYDVNDAPALVERAVRRLDTVPESRRQGPRKQQARATAIVAHYIWESWTGRTGARAYDWRRGRKYGAFAEFLDELFAALAIRASAIAQCDWIRSQVRNSDALLPGLLRGRCGGEGLIDSRVFEIIVNQTEAFLTGKPLPPPTFEDQATMKLAGIEHCYLPGPGLMRSQYGRFIQKHRPDLRSNSV